MSTGSGFLEDENFFEIKIKAEDNFTDETETEESTPSFECLQILEIKPAVQDILKNKKGPIILDGTFFEIKDIKDDQRSVIAVCKLCGSVLKGFLTSTSNFLSHLKVKHPDYVEQYENYKEKAYIPPRKKSKHSNFNFSKSAESENEFGESKFENNDPLNTNRSSFDCLEISSSSITDGPAHFNNNNKKIPLVLDGTFFEIKYIRDDKVSVVAMCKLCGGNLKGLLTSTSNFLAHLKVKHPKDILRYEKYKEKAYISQRAKTKYSTFSYAAAENSVETEQSLSLKNSISSSPSSSQAIQSTSLEENQNTINKLITYYIIEASCPLNTVELPSFKKLVNELSKIRGNFNNKIECPTRHLLMKQLNHFKLQMKAQIIDEIKLNKYFCTTADIWSAYEKTYLGVTLHFLNSNFQRKSYALACRRSNNRFDLHNYEQQMQSIHEEFSLNKENISITITDNGSNMMENFIKLGYDSSCYVDCEENKIDYEVDRHEILFKNFGCNFNELNKSNDISDTQLPFHHTCCSHIFSMIVHFDVQVFCRSNKDFSNIYYSSLNKCFSIWNYLKNTSISETKNFNRDAAINIKTPCPTRRNSLYDSLADLLLAVNSEKIMNLFSQLNIPNISENELEFLIEFKNIIAPIAQTIDKLESDENITMGDIIPCILNCVYKLDKIIALKSSSKYCKDLTEYLTKSIKKRFSYAFDDFNTKKAQHYILASVSHPKWKIKWCLNNFEQQSLVKKLFLQEIENVSKNEIASGANQHDFLKNSNSIQQDIETPKDCFFEFIQENEVTENEYFYESIMNKYLGEKSESLDMLNLFPAIKNIFLKYNSGIPSSAPVDKLFCFSSMVLSPKRVLTSDEVFENCLLLKANKYTEICFEENDQDSSID